MDKLAIYRRVYPETNASGFPHNDQTVAFYNQVRAILRPDSRVLDFGAGRGEFMETEKSPYRRDIQNLRGSCAHVDGCDVDPVVLKNPTLDHAEVIKIGEALPYADASFDLIVSRYVFEHVANPEWAASELLRVLDPGGWICAMTPNKWGYVALMSRLFPNRVHSNVLKSVQPERLEQDVFPTVYKLNRPSDVRRHFRGAKVYHYTVSDVPSYHFGRVWVFRLFQLLHWLTPPALGVSSRYFIQKPG